MKFLWLTGFLAKLWSFLKPLLKSEVGKFLADKNVQTLAISAVERAARLDLDGDGKYDHATAELSAELKRLGVQYSKGWLGLAVETAWRLVKAEVEAEKDE